MQPQNRLLDVGFQMAVRLWTPPQPDPDRPPFLLVHGLASNARTWDQVARRLAAAGHPVASIDQRGHGGSDKPDAGYDFATITQDLRTALDRLAWRRPILAGQSWGGNVLLEFGARYPGVARQLVFVDGGFLNLKNRGAWEQVAVELRPPDLSGTPRRQMAAWIRQNHPDWSDAGVEATLHNFETLPDGTIRPWLTLARHLRILRALYDQDTNALLPQVQEPVLICAADDGSPENAARRALVQTAVSRLPRVELAWFAGADHDIHVHRPEALAARMLQFTNEFPAPM